MNIETKKTGSSLSSSEFNQIPDELENIITNAGIEKSATNLTQISQSISQMVGDADFYSTSGTANDIVLSPVSPRLAPASLTNGLRVRFKAIYNNTDVATVNVAGLGAKNITSNDINISSGNIVADKNYELVYKLSTDSFELMTRDFSSLLNKNMITNCILEAPNGVMSITPTSYTIKQGLKVLIPNGRNTDGTLKNIEYTIEQDETREYITTSTTDRICFLIDKNNSHFRGYQVVLWWKDAVFVSEVEPKTLTDALPYSSIVWYQPSTNKWWYIPDNAPSPYNWEQIELCPIATIDRQGTVELKKLYNFTPVSIAKEQDIDGEWVNNDVTIFSSSAFTTNVKTYDLKDILPNDGCKYECIFIFSMSIPANTQVAYHNLIAYSDLDFGRSVIMFENVQLSYTTYFGGYSHHIIVGSQRKLNVNLYSTSSTAGRYSCSLIGYRKVR